MVSRDVDLAQAKQEIKVRRGMTDAQRQRFADENRQLVAVKAIQKAKSLIPARYRSPEIPKLTAEVKGHSDIVDVDLMDD